MDGMDNLLMTYRDMTTRDWLVDAAVALAAFAVGCLQLMLTASSIIIPDLALRQYLGVVNVVPDLQVFVGLGMTVVPLVLRRRFPLDVYKRQGEGRRCRQEGRQRRQQGREQRKQGRVLA